MSALRPVKNMRRKTLIVNIFLFLENAPERFERSGGRKKNASDKNVLAENVDLENYLTR